MGMNKEIRGRLKKMRRDMRKLAVETIPRMIQELRLERLTNEDIAHEIGVTSVSVIKWSNGEAPSKAHAEAVSRVHEQVTLLKSHGIDYDSIRRKKTLDQAYMEKKGEAA
jgi:hypothetical protein